MRRLKGWIKTMQKRTSSCPAFGSSAMTRPASWAFSLRASGRRQLLVLGLLALILLQTAPLRAELRRIEVRRRDDFGTYERIIGRAFFAVDPALAANGGIADVKFAPKNADGQVEFAGDLL